MDLILYSKGDDFFENSLNFVKTFISKEKFENIRNYLQIEEKSFDADLFAEEEVIKIPKKYEMTFSTKRSYSAKNYSILNAFKTHSEKKYFILKKIY